MNLSIYSLAGDEGPAFWFLNTLVIVKASAQQTAGAFTLLDNLAPVGAGSPYHVHRAEDEAFYLLDGEIEFFSGEQRFTRGPGAYVFLPRDIPHGFRVISGSPARYLILLTPSGFEQFVRELGEPAPTPTLPEPSPPDMEKLAAIAPKYGLELLGPLPD